jgi:signal transduction histidine kinase
MRNYARFDQTIDQSVNIREIIEETEIILANKLKRWSYSKYIDSDLPFISCNRSQISQVIANLISNACDSLSEMKLKDKSFKGILKTKISLFSEKKIRIEVEDNGTGLKTEIQDKILYNLSEKNILNQTEIEKCWPFIILTVNQIGM